MITNQILKIHDYLFREKYYYLYAMTIAHLIIIIYTIIGLDGYTSKTYYTLSLNPYSSVIKNISIFKLQESIIILFEIYIIDLIFFLILMFEFKQLKLTFKKIIIIETIIMILSFSFTPIRDIMFFLSLNSLQITLYYSILMRYIFFMKYVFISASYVYVIQLLLYPIWLTISAYIWAQSV